MKDDKIKYGREKDGLPEKDVISLMPELTMRDSSVGGLVNDNRNEEATSSLKELADERPGRSLEREKQYPSMASIWRGDGGWGLVGQRHKWLINNAQRR